MPEPPPNEGGSFGNYMITLIWFDNEQSFSTLTEGKAFSTVGSHMGSLCFS